MCKELVFHTSAVRHVPQNKQEHSNTPAMFVLPAVQSACVHSQRTADRTEGPKIWHKAAHRNTVTRVMPHDKREARLNKRTNQRINTEVQYTHCTETPHGTRRQSGHTCGTHILQKHRCHKGDMETQFRCDLLDSGLSGAFSSVRTN